MRTLVLAAVAMVGCATMPRAVPSIRQPDVDAWRGVSRLELETHPFFSSLPKTVAVISDGSELWDLANCNSQVCCHNQFFVRGPIVESYRLVGACRTACSTRPASHQCGALEHAWEADQVAQWEAYRESQESRQRWGRAVGAASANFNASMRAAPRTTTTHCQTIGGITSCTSY